MTIPIVRKHENFRLVSDGFKLTYYHGSDFPNNQVADTLYHYTNIDAADKITSGKNIWFMKNNTSNDPLDGHIMEYIKDAFHEIKQSFSGVNFKVFSNLLEGHYGAWEHVLYNTARYGSRTNYSKAFVFSLTEDSSNNQMWESYGDKYKGACLAFSGPVLARYLTNESTVFSRNFDSSICGDFYGDFNVLKYDACFHSKVIYDETIKRNIVRAILENAYANYKPNPPDPITNVSDNSAFYWDVVYDLWLCAHFFKDEEKWSHEKEYRFLLHQSKYCSPPCETTEEKPYINVEFGDNLEECIDRVIVYNAANETVKQIRKRVKVECRDL